MPIYEYFCQKCDKRFEKRFTTFANAELFVDAHRCVWCRKKAARTYESAPKVFFKFYDAPMYASNHNPDKD